MRWGLASLGAVALLVGCGPVKPADPPVLIEPSQIEGKLLWSSALHDKLVSVDGYITYDNGVRGDAIAMGPQLNSAPMGGGNELVRFMAERGDGPNQLKLAVVSQGPILGREGLPETITFDIAKSTFQDKAGQAHPLSAKVRVTGTATYVRVGDAGFWSDPDAESPIGRRFKMRLTDVVLEAPPGY
jgi:hypothetical protein